MRRHGSATALKTSELVAARAMTRSYSYIGICQELNLATSASDSRPADVDEILAPVEAYVRRVLARDGGDDGGNTMDEWVLGDAPPTAARLTTSSPPTLPDSLCL